MSSTKHTKGNRARLAVASLVVCAACLSSVSYAPEAQAQELELQAETVDTASSVEAVVVGGVLAAYGWAADKTYDLGKEVGKWLAGPDEPAPEEPTKELASVQGRSLDYALD